MFRPVPAVERINLGSKAVARFGHGDDLGKFPLTQIRATRTAVSLFNIAHRAVDRMRRNLNFPPGYWDRWR